MRKFWEVFVIVVCVTSLLSCTTRRENIQTRVALPDEVVQVSYGTDGSPVVAEIEGKPISERMVMDFIRSYGVGPHGMKGVEKTLQNFLDRELAVYDVVSRDLPRLSQYAGQVKIFYYSTLGADYLKNKLREKVEITGEEVAGVLPEKFLVGNFDLISFPSEEEAREAMEEIKSVKDFYHYAEKHRDRVSSTGDIYPGSGFFHPFDDATLFAMKSNTFAGYFETGIGPALVAVRYVRELTPKEVEELVAKRRSDLVERKVPRYVNEILDRHKISVDSSKVYELAEREIEFRSDALLDEKVAQVDDIPITYLNVKRWLRRSYLEYLKGITGETLGKFMLNDTNNLVKQIAAGLEAEKEGYSLTDESYRRGFDELRRRYYYYIGIIDHLGGLLHVTEKEMKKYYQENLDRFFRVPERMKVAHIFTRRYKKAKDIYEKLMKGESFEELAEKYSEDPSSRGNGGVVGMIYKGRKFYRDIQDELFKPEYRKKGAVTDILIGAEGYHIVKVLEYYPEKTFPYEEVKESIRSAVMYSKFEDARKEYVEELKKKYKLVIHEKEAEALKEKIKKFYEKKKDFKKVNPH
ncbi:MAG: hypothetical protein D6713_07620 [Deltaproteobacteria bacterium]|nr:MAG: hypothetical protein D6713_07620 [Deltaproteobacteria bacterium]